jgi:uncharacterized protein (DUF3084 family)
VDRELGNQRSLRDEDQAVFNRVAESRDQLQIAIAFKTEEIVKRDQQINALAFSVSELEQMVAALQSLANVNEGVNQ